MWDGYIPMQWSTLFAIYHCIQQNKNRHNHKKFNMKICVIYKNITQIILVNKTKKLNIVRISFKKNHLKERIGLCYYKKCFTPVNLQHLCYLSFLICYVLQEFLKFRSMITDFKILAIQNTFFVLVCIVYILQILFLILVIPNSRRKKNIIEKNIDKFTL